MFSVYQRKKTISIKWSSATAAVSGIMLLTACGGGSGGNIDPQLEAFNSLNRSADALLERMQPISYSPLEAVPDAGSMDYAGYFMAQLGNSNDDLTDQALGQMSVQVEYAQPQMVSGVVSNLLDQGGNALSGEITLFGGLLDRGGDPNTNATLVFQGSGDLIDKNDNSIAFDLTFEGDFLNSDISGIGGDILGSATSDGTIQAVGGLFIVEEVAPD